MQYCDYEQNNAQNTHERKTTHDNGNADRLAYAFNQFVCRKKNGRRVCEYVSVHACLLLCGPHNACLSRTLDCVAMEAPLYIICKQLSQLCVCVCARVCVGVSEHALSMFKPTHENANAILIIQTYLTCWMTHAHANASHKEGAWNVAPIRNCARTRNKPTAYAETGWQQYCANSVAIEPYGVFKAFGMLS